MYLDQFKLDGRTALVTGGGRGIGLAAAEALSEAGAKIIIADREPELLESGKAELAQKGYPCETIALDVTGLGRRSGSGTDGQ